MKVLLVDDDAVCRLGLEAMVQRLGHECLVAADGREAWNILARQQIDLLIADREMPFLDGLELCRRVRTELATGHVYVILATGFGSLEHAREGMLAGADDYLVKPVQLDQLELRLIAGERVTSLQRRLEHANQELRVSSRRDALTGLGNRRCLSEDLVVMSDRARRYGHGYGIALIDVDYFKAFNDCYGHQKGDEALKAVAAILREASRAGDTWYRYGGEEFLCIYPEQSVQEAHASVDRLRASVADLAIPHANGGIGGTLTLSAGVAEFSQGEADAQAVVRLADTALYEAKRLGRNRTEVAAAPGARLLRSG